MTEVMTCDTKGEMDGSGLSDADITYIKNWVDTMVYWGDPKPTYEDIVSFFKRPEQWGKWGNDGLGIVEACLSANDMSPQAVITNKGHRDCLECAGQTDHRRINFPIGLSAL